MITPQRPHKPERWSSLRKPAVVSVANLTGHWQSPSVDSKTAIRLGLLQPGPWPAAVTVAGSQGGPRGHGPAASGPGWTAGAVRSRESTGAAQPSGGVGLGAF